MKTVKRTIKTPRGTFHGEVMSCDCWFHRYGSVHCILGNDRVFDHSQGTWDAELRGIEHVETYPSETYRHGMTADELRAVNQ